MASDKKDLPGTLEENEAGAGMSDEALDARRRRLEEELRKVAPKAEPERNETSGKAGWGAAVNMSSGFIAGIVTGALIGYLLDQFAGTTPWGMIVFLFLGFAAGVLNVMRATGKVADPYKTRMDTSAGDRLTGGAQSGRNDERD